MSYKSEKRKRQNRRKVNPEKLESRIAGLKLTIADMEKMPPALGSKWQVGMLQYYGQVLAELESYRNASVQSKQKPE